MINILPINLFIYIYTYLYIYIYDYIPQLLTHLRIPGFFTSPTFGSTPKYRGTLPPKTASFEAPETNQSHGCIHGNLTVLPPPNGDMETSGMELAVLMGI